MLGLGLVGGGLGSRSSLGKVWKKEGGKHELAMDWDRLEGFFPWM